MSDTALALCGVFCGCQVNVFLLELITLGSPNTFYALTFLQYVAVAVLALPLVSVVHVPGSQRGKMASWFPLRLRPSRLLLSHKVILAFAAWLMSVSNNLVFGLHVSVPLHATFRSSSLLLNMLAGYFFLSKRYTLWQVLCAGIICVGLVALALEKSRKQAAASPAAAALSTDEHFWWLCGIAILTATTALSTGLGIFQEHMYNTARLMDEEMNKDGSKSKTRKRESGVAPPPMWAEALFFSHLLAIPLFFFQPWRLAQELTSIAPDNVLHFVLNAVTQYICVAGVYVLNDKTSAFTLILTLTLRKLGTFALSVMYFGHYRYFTPVEWLAMVLAMLAGALYPMLPKPAPAAPTPSKKHQ